MAYIDMLTLAGSRLPVIPEAGVTDTRDLESVGVTTGVT